MVVMRAAASVDDNTAPRVSCPIIRTVEILREKAGICKLEASQLEASHAANDARRQGLERDPCQRHCRCSGDTGRGCPCRFPARPRLSDT